MRFSTTTAMLIAAWGLGLAAAAPSPSPSSTANSNKDDDDDSDVGYKASIRLPASVTGQLEVDTQGVLEYAEKNQLRLPETVKLALRLAPSRLLVIDGGEANCASPLQLPDNAGLKGRLCAPEGSTFSLLQLLVPASGSGGSGSGTANTPILKRGQCSLGCYHNCVSYIGDNDNMAQYHT